MGIGMMGHDPPENRPYSQERRNYESADSSLPTVRLLGTKVA